MPQLNRQWDIVSVCVLFALGDSCHAQQYFSFVLAVRSPNSHPGQITKMWTSQN